MMFHPFMFESEVNQNSKFTASKLLSQNIHFQNRSLKKHPDM